MRVFAPIATQLEAEAEIEDSAASPVATTPKKAARPVSALRFVMAKPSSFLLVGSKPKPSSPGMSTHSSHGT
jgi:hypothetical protein